MESSFNIINALIVDVFNDILTIEESALRSGSFNDVSVSEVHTIEAIGLHTQRIAGEVAKKLNITAGTLTVAINNLVKKGYVQRSYSETDRRVVMLGLTKKGRLLFRIHAKFHFEMIKQAIVGLDKDEEVILASALGNLHSFLSNTFLKNSREQ